MVLTLLLLSAGGFAPTTEKFPAATGEVYDIYDNHWALNGEGRLLVKPAQSKSAYVLDQISHLPDGQWRFLQADEHGYLWIANNTSVLRLDPRKPLAGWEDFTAALGGGSVTAIATAPSGAMLVAMDAGKLIELDRTDRLLTTMSEAPPHIEKLHTADDGAIWVIAQGKAYRKPATADTWQRHWEMVARLPGANHDLSGDAIGSKFYMAGGQTATWGYPATAHTFDGLYEFDLRTRRWRTAATLARPKFYVGTAALAGKLWVIGGGVRNADGEAHPVNTVEICDPKSGKVQPGPAFPYAIEMPLAVHIRDRIYVAGRGKLLSIGQAESTWRTEPDMPATAGLQALAGTTYRDKFYIALPKVGLIAFDPALHSWQTVSTTYQPRSPQMAAFAHGIWCMGGREVPGDGTMIFDPSSNSWRRGPNLPRELAWGAAITVANRLLVAGGAAGRCYNNRTFLLRTP